MKLIYTALFALASTAVNACYSSLCEGGTVLRVVPCTKECMGRPCHLYECPDSPYTQYICGKDKTKCDEICRTSQISPITTTRQSPPNPEKMVHNIRTKDEFQDALKKYPIVVVDFYSTHSAESKHIAATFAHAYGLDKFKDFRFVKVDIDDLKGLAEELGVSQPATFHMYKNGEKINDLQSEHKEDLIQFLETGL
ncbi:Thioredoxin-1 [Fusarium oxysporum f. sp. rapae]|uniref:Thioredoxin-1 n=1 Tax=Fusarium oxysporum f. sp. rapae TaxID=485398 RepID=A0A8J5U0T6_FUSOX|nr:Thioredoxin-1 [Fusarium oxysporum f. sp. rapae]